MFLILDGYTEFDEKVVKVDAWYDRHTRDWCIQLLNKDGYQVGDAERMCGKKAVEEEVKYLREKYGI